MKQDRFPSLRELRRLDLPGLVELAEDLRQEIILTTLRNGGHLGASLGAVELAIALHSVFESPREPIIWDVGHQAYAHKILTGRGDRFGTLRTTGGISGFPSRFESEHDVFGVGHSSTAFSAALAIAWERAGSRDWTVAVVGDGGLTAGLSFEAINNLRATSTGPLLVVLNDNQMSIGGSVGSFPALLNGGHAARIFEMLGFRYVGPVHGHDLRELIPVLNEIRNGEGHGPVLLHAITQKGKGYAPAEEKPHDYHGVSPIQDKRPGADARSGRTFSEAFGAAACRLAERDEKIVAVCAAMTDGTGLAGFSERFPSRFFDVGIAEQHAVTFAAGLATQGRKPLVAIYSTFLQRALDSIIHDVALQELCVGFAVDRAGLVGADGPTHHGVFDLAYLGMIPGMRVFAPTGLGDVETLLEEGFGGAGPFAIRYPRGDGDRELVEEEGRGCRIHRWTAKPDVVLVGLGACASRVVAAAELIDPDRRRVAVASTTWRKPISPFLLAAVGEARNAKVLTVEDGVVCGGFGQAFSEALGGVRRVRHLGVPDRFVPHGSVEDLLDLAGLSAERIARATSALMGPEE